jgi:hypothetical protein
LHALEGVRRGYDWHCGHAAFKAILRRKPAKPMPAKPINIINHVEASGIAPIKSSLTKKLPAPTGALPSVFQSPKTTHWLDSS